MRKLHQLIRWMLLVVISFVLVGCMHTTIKVTLERNGKYTVETNSTTFGCVSYKKGTATTLQCSTYTEVDDEEKD